MHLGTCLLGKVAGGSLPHQSPEPILVPITSPGPPSMAPTRAILSSETTHTPSFFKSHFSSPRVPGTRPPLFPQMFAAACEHAPSNPIGTGPFSNFGRIQTERKITVTL